MNGTTDKDEFDLIIKPRQSMLSIDFKGLWRYRDLLMLFVKRDFVATYKQTVLGPLWFLIQPILTTVTFYIIGSIANIPTDGIPPVLFYMAGIILWNYYADCLTKTSETFTANAAIFGKVYFPRLIVPVSIVVSNFVRFSIQFVLFLAFWLYFYFFKGAVLHMNTVALLFPVLLLLMAGHGLAMGIIISSLTTKYRDLKFLVTFGVQLLMYATPVIYPLSSVSDKYKGLMLLNPMASIIECFKYGFLGVGFFSPAYLLYSLISLILILFIGVVLFNKIEKSFMDTI
ncbi:MAG: transporter permease [Bacteroidetes bacterium]|nr:transporter permease [Bacteroidota bacterium]